MPAGRALASLKEKEAIRSVWWGRLVLESEGGARRLQAGIYELRRGEKAHRLLHGMVSGRSLLLKVAAPEGWASWQIAERLEKVGVCSAAEFRAVVSSRAAEGYLFPDTYLFPPGHPAARVAETMGEKWSAAWRETLDKFVAAGHIMRVSPGSGTRAEDVVLFADGRRMTVGQVMILASLVEREARLPEERPRVAAVYVNRLKKRMLLEADPTVQFALGEWKERLYYKDLDVKSPYNTYRRRGLPPGPICSPGRPAWEAVLDPAPGDELFFVADGRGGHKFSTTYAEHQRRVRERNRERSR
jgi:UPF0755 protein